MLFCRSITTTSSPGDGELIVWPSNEAAEGPFQRNAGDDATPATSPVLVDCGLVIRRDSPNGKRFARKGRGGEIEQAYGFDLSPIVTRAQRVPGHGRGHPCREKGVSRCQGSA